MSNVVAENLPDAHGHFGQYGGRYVPETLMHPLQELEAEYARLQTQLARPGWISQGYVQDRGPGAGGPHYQWTRKERGKTVSVALSREQYEALAEAIRNWRQLERVLDRMQQLTRHLAPLA